MDLVDADSEISERGYYKSLRSGRSFSSCRAILHSAFVIQTVTDFYGQWYGWKEGAQWRLASAWVISFSQGVAIARWNTQHLFKYNCSTCFQYVSCPRKYGVLCKGWSSLQYLTVTFQKCRTRGRPSMSDRTQTEQRQRQNRTSTVLSTQWCMVEAGGGMNLLSSPTSNNEHGKSWLRRGFCAAEAVSGYFCCSTVVFLRRNL